MPDVPMMWASILFSVRPGDLIDLIPTEVRPWLVRAGIALAALLVIRALWRRLSRLLRRRRPPTIHPKLAKYNVDRAKLDRRRRELAAGVIATSMSGHLAGFRIARQVEAVFVEGYRSPDEALIALKAAAVERGANALVNVRTDRNALGRCTAAGDAVFAEPCPESPRAPGPD